MYYYKYMLVAKGAEGLLCEPINSIPVHSELQIPGLFYEPINPINLAFLPYSAGETIFTSCLGGEGYSSNQHTTYLPPLCLIRI